MNGQAGGVTYIVVAGEDVTHEVALFIELTYRMLAPFAHEDVALFVAAHARRILKVLGARACQFGYLEQKLAT